MGENRRAILEAAGRPFRERGFEAVTVADIMHAADLTNGGFNGYFKSKDELIAGALGDVLERSDCKQSERSSTLFSQAILSASLF